MKDCTEVPMKIKLPFTLSKMRNGFQFMMVMEEQCALSFWRIICMNFSSSSIGKTMYQTPWEKHFWWLKKNGKRKVTTVDHALWWHSFTKTHVMWQTWVIQELFWQVRTVKNSTKSVKTINHQILMSKRESSLLEGKSTRQQPLLRQMEDITTRL